MRNTQTYIDLASSVVENSLLDYGFPIDIQTGQYKQQSIELMELLLKRQLEEALPIAAFDVDIVPREDHRVSLCLNMYINNESSHLEFVEK